MGGGGASPFRFPPTAVPAPVQDKMMESSIRICHLLLAFKPL